MAAVVQGINIAPQGISIAPTGVNVGPTGASISPTLIAIGPYDTSVSGQVCVLTCHYLCCMLSTSRMVPSTTCSMICHLRQQVV